MYIFLWYAFNIIFNIVNKSTLNAFPCPWFISTLQLGEMPTPAQAYTHDIMSHTDDYK